MLPRYHSFPRKEPSRYCSPWWDPFRFQEALQALPTTLGAKSSQGRSWGSPEHPEHRSWQHVLLAPLPTRHAGMHGTYCEKEESTLKSSAWGLRGESITRGEVSVQQMARWPGSARESWHRVLGLLGVTPGSHLGHPGMLGWLCGCLALPRAQLRK